MTPYCCNLAKTTQGGFGLIEVMFAMVILAFAVLGVLGTFQWADHGVQYGQQATKALALAQSRLEAKRTGPWNRLLVDDLDRDGIPDMVMRDDGHDPDATSGDGIYTASAEISGINLVWTLQTEPRGALIEAGVVVIKVRASYPIARSGRGQFELGSLRANPNYLGG
jgi:prepilin-type N-terminal cleavage/methylation domain-containing protein